MYVFFCLYGFRAILICGYMYFSDFPRCLTNIKHHWNNGYDFISYLQHSSSPDKPFGTKLEASVPDNIGVINSSVILRCTADANPPITAYNIYHNGTLVSNSSIGVLNITRALADHEGSYVCIPYNAYGAGEAASLNVTFVGEFWITDDVNLAFWLVCTHEWRQESKKFKKKNEKMYKENGL